MEFLQHYVVLPSQAAIIAVTLWVLHTWVLAAFDVTIYLIVKSPTMRAGKTRLFEVLEHLVPVPWRVIGPSEAVLLWQNLRECPVAVSGGTHTIFYAQESTAGTIRHGFKSADRT